MNNKMKAAMTAMRSGAAIKMATLSAALLLSAGTARAEILTWNCGRPPCQSLPCPTTPDNSVTATLNTETGVLTISPASSTGVMFNFTEENQPQWLDYHSAITSVVIGNGLLTISAYAFNGCENLTSVSIPSSMLTIGDRSFNGCTSLTSVTIPDDVSYLGWDAFAFTGLTSVTIPANVRTLGQGVFWQCSALASVNFAQPSLLEYIGPYAFSGTIITSINIPANVSNLGSFLDFDITHSLTAINVSDANENYSSVDGVVFNKNKTTLIYYPRGKQGAYTIPNSVTTMENNAFRDSRITAINIPNSIDNIPEGVFVGTYNMRIVAVNNTTPPSVAADAFDYGTTWIGGEERQEIHKILLVPASSIDAYRAADVWKDFEDIRAIESIEHVTGITLDRTTMFLINDPDVQRRITYTITPENASIPNVVWYSSNTNVVDNTGNVAGNYLYFYTAGAGETVLTGITVDGGFTARCTVRVVDIGELVAQNSALQEQVSTLTSQNSALQAQLSACTAASGGNCSEYQSQLTAAQDQLRACEAASSGNCSEYQTLLAAANGRVDALRADSARLQQNLNTANQTISARDATISQLNDDLTACRDGITAVAAETAQTLAVYPNPAGSMLYITDEYDGLVEIYDINGTLLLSSTSNSINISALPAGIYIVKASGKAAKVVKQ